jgi:hypothetical protein
MGCTNETCSFAEEELTGRGVGVAGRAEMVQQTAADLFAETQREREASGCRPCAQSNSTPVPSSRSSRRSR